MNAMERAVLLQCEDEGWPIDVLAALTEDDILDLGMLRGEAVNWTGGRVVELIDWRHDDREWYERKDWT